VKAHFGRKFMTDFQEAGPRVPGHVPDELLRDFNIDEFTREFDDPYLAGAVGKITS